MRNHTGFVVILVAASALAAATVAGQGTPPAAGDTVIVVEKPTYTTIPLEIDVNKSAADVWKRVGNYCDIAEWLQIPAGCKILAGTDNTVGAVRSVANEVLVGKTQYLVHLHAAGPRWAALQPVPRHARSASGDPDDVEDLLHADVRQLDADRRRGTREGQGGADGDVHAGDEQHEAARGRRDAAAEVAPRDGPELWTTGQFTTTVTSLEGRTDRGESFADGLSVL